MSQVTYGPHALLSSSVFYRSFQALMGAHAVRTAFVKEYVRPSVGDNILDIGCGTADILDYLPDGIRYWGFDISARYIHHARSKHGSRGSFAATEFTLEHVPTLPPIDIALATGLLHHLDDAVALPLLAAIAQALRPGGRLVTLDGVLTANQNPLARGLILLDRGRHVRTPDGYRALLSASFPATQLEIRPRRWIPYTYCFAECPKSAAA